MKLARSLFPFTIAIKLTAAKSGRLPENLKKILTVMSKKESLTLHELMAKAYCTIMTRRVICKIKG